MEVMVTTGAIRRVKLQSNLHHQQTNTQLYRQDALPVTQPTASKHWREVHLQRVIHYSCNCRTSGWRRRLTVTARLTGVWLPTSFPDGQSCTASIGGRSFLTRSSSKDRGRKRSGSSQWAFESRSCGLPIAAEVFEAFWKPAEISGFKFSVIFLTVAVTRSCRRAVVTIFPHPSPPSVGAEVPRAA